MRRILNPRGARPIFAVMLIIAIWPLSGCAPAGAAVGNTQTTRTAIHHDSVDRNDIMIGVVGSGDPSADHQVMTALANDHMGAFYAATDQSADHIGTAAHDIDDMLDRAAKAVMIISPDMSGQAGAAWRPALLRARERGVPIVLVGARTPPSDGRLYAASLTIDDHTKSSVSLGTVMTQVINDRPHAVRITVSLERR